MQSYEQYARDQDDSAFGDFLVHSIAHWCGLDGTEKDIVQRIEKSVYRGTGCGAWVKFDEIGLIVGTIVEGSDAEYSERIDVNGLDIDDESETLLRERFGAALANCERFAEENFQSEE